MARRMAGSLPLEMLGWSSTRLRAERFVREFHHLCGPLVPFGPVIPFELGMTI